MGNRPSRASREISRHAIDMSKEQMDVFIDKQWYEIARSNIIAQDACISVYTHTKLGPNTIQLTRACRQANGASRDTSFTLTKIQPHTQKAEFYITRGEGVELFKGRYNILYLERLNNENGWLGVVVGSSWNYVWILSTVANIPKSSVCAALAQLHGPAGVGKTLIYRDGTSCPTNSPVESSAKRRRITEEVEKQRAETVTKWSRST